MKIDAQLLQARLSTELDLRYLVSVAELELKMVELSGDTAEFIAACTHRSNVLKKIHITIELED